MKLLRKVCCILLVFLLFVGLSQVSEAVLLEDEGTEGNANEYAFTGGFEGTVEDEGSIVKTGSQSLKCIAKDAHFSALREVSSYFKWSDFISLEVWVYRTSATNDRFEIKLIKSSDIYDNAEVFHIDISDQSLDSWKKYTQTKADASSSYGGLTDDDYVKYHTFTMTMDGQDPDDIVYFDGLNISLAQETTEIPTGQPISFLEEGTEHSASEYDTPSGFGGTIADETSNVKVGSYSIKLTTVSLHYQKRRALSSAFQWGDFNSLTVWVYRTSTTNWIFELKLLETSDVYGNAIVFHIDISDQSLNTWQQYTQTTADGSHSYGGLTDTDTITYMVWAITMDGADSGDILYLDGLNINPGADVTETTKAPTGQPLCLGTLTVSAFTVIALVAVRMKVKNQK